MRPPAGIRPANAPRNRLKKMRLMEDSSMTIVIADDEPGVRKRLRELLTEQPGVTLIGEASDGPRTIALMREQRPAVALLDSRLPRLNALEVLAEMGSRTLPLIIFIGSAGDRHRQTACAGVAGWILKPVTRAELQEALTEARRQIRLRKPGAFADPGGAGRIAVKTGARVLLLDLDAIEHITAANNHCRIVTRDRTVPVRENLRSLTARLPPGRFIRVNRFAAINGSAVATLESKSHGDWTVHLHNGTKLTVTRTRRAEVLRRLRIST